MADSPGDTGNSADIRKAWRLVHKATVRTQAAPIVLKSRNSQVSGEAE